MSEDDDLYMRYCKICGDPFGPYGTPTCMCNAHPRLGLNRPRYQWRRLAYVLLAISLACGLASLVLK